jgi:hypothetical protein
MRTTYTITLHADLADDAEKQAALDQFIRDRAIETIALVKLLGLSRPPAITATRHRYGDGTVDIDVT